MISLIVAVAKNGVIGNKGEIPWHLPDDFKHFAKVTKGHTVIMGRKTYDSIIKKLGRPLSERKNIVITSQYNFRAPGCTVLRSIDEAIGLYSPIGEEVFVIGGSMIYEKFLPVTEKLYITEVNCDLRGDTVFPFYDEEKWSVRSKEHHSKDEKHLFEFDYIELVKNK